MADIFEAIRAHDAPAVRDLLAADPSLARRRDPSGVTAVSLARYTGADECLLALLATNPSLDVFEAATVGDLDRIRWFEAHDPSRLYAWSADGFMPIHLASFFGHAAIVEELLEWGSPVSERSRNALGVHPLNSAAAGGHRRIVELLLAAGADPRATDASGFTPLDAAAQNGDEEMAALLRG